MIGTVFLWRSSIEDRRVLPDVQPGYIAAQFSVDPPNGGDDASVVLADLENLIAPGITEVQYPMNFGWFPSNGSLSSILGDFAFGRRRSSHRRVDPWTRDMDVAPSTEALVPLRIDGPDEIRARLRRDLDNAQWFASEIAKLDGREVVVPTRLQTVCVRAVQVA